MNTNRVVESCLKGEAGAGERIPTYRLVGTKFWGKYIQKYELKAKFGQNSNIVGTKFTSGLRVGTKLKNVLPRLNKCLFFQVRVF